MEKSGEDPTTLETSADEHKLKGYGHTNEGGRQIHVWELEGGIWPEGISRNADGRNEWVFWKHSKNDQKCTILIYNQTKKEYIPLPGERE